MNKVSIIAQAKDKADQEGKSWSKYVVDLIEADTKKQTEQQNTNVISILSNGQQLCITEFIPRLYENNVERKQQLKWIQTVDNKELIDFTSRNKDTANMIKLRRDNENRESRERAKFRRLNIVIPNIDKIISIGNKDNSIEIPIELDDIPLDEDND